MAQEPTSVTDEMPDEPRPEAKEGAKTGLEIFIDLSFRKYLKIWIWSIVFGLNTSLLYTLTGGLLSGRYNLEVSIVLLLPMTLGGLLQIVSWFSLLRYLQLSLIPMLLQEYNDSDPSSQKKQDKDAGLLMLAMRYSILSVIVRLAGSIFELIFGSLVRYN